MGVVKLWAWFVVAPKIGFEKLATMYNACQPNLLPIPPHPTVIKPFLVLSVENY